MKSEKVKVWKASGIGALAAIAALGLVGCQGKMTPESLMKDAAAKVAEVKSYEANMLMDLQMAGEISGISIKIGMNMDMDMEIISDPQAMHAKGSVSVEAAGQNQDLSVEMYSEEEDGKIVTYAKASDGKWEKKESEGISDLMSIYKTEDLKAVTEGLTLKEETEDVDRVACYVLTGTVKGSDIQDMVDGVMDSMEDQDLMGGLDLANVEIPIDYYIAKSDSLPVKIAIDMKSVMEESAKSAARGEMTLTCDTCTLEMKFTSFDKVEAITVPEDAKSATETVAAEPAKEEELGQEEIDALFSQQEETKETEAAETKEQESEPQTVASSSGTGDMGAGWDSYTFTVGGKTVAVPCTYQEMLDAGLELNTEYSNVNEEYVVNAGEYTFGYMQLPQSDKVDISVYFVNNAEEAKKVPECEIGGFEAYSYVVEDASGVDIVFPGGIKLGGTKEEAMAAYGEPADKYESEDYATYTWQDAGDFYKSCTISVDGDGRIIGYKLLNLQQ